MNTKQRKVIKAFKNDLKDAAKRKGLFVLGMMVVFAIIGFFEAIEYQPIYEPSVPWWVYAIIVIILTIVVGKTNER